jgi:hypothetical protein
LIRYSLEHRKYLSGNRLGLGFPNYIGALYWGI